MVLIVLFLPFLVISELRRANHASHCYFYYALPESLMIEKFFRSRTQDFSLPLLQLNTDYPAVGVLEVSVFALHGLASSLMATCTNRKNRRWHPSSFKFEIQFGDVVYCSNPHKVITDGSMALVEFDHRIAFQVTRGMPPELRVKVWGCKTRKLTHGVKLKAVLGTASLDLSALLTLSRSGSDVRQMSAMLPLTRRREEGAQALVTLHLTFRQNRDAARLIASEHVVRTTNRPEGLPVTGPDGAIWVAHPSPSTIDAHHDRSCKVNVEDKEELGSYQSSGPELLSLDAGRCARVEDMAQVGTHDRSARDIGPQTSHNGSGLGNGAFGVLGL